MGQKNHEHHLGNVNHNQLQHSDLCKPLGCARAGPTAAPPTLNMFSHVSVEASATNSCKNKKKKTCLLVAEVLQVSFLLDLDSFDADVVRARLVEGPEALKRPAHHLCSGTERTKRVSRWGETNHKKPEIRTVPSTDRCFSSQNLA